MPVRILHILGSAAEAATAHARIVVALAQHGDTDRHSTGALFLAEGGPLVQRLRDAGVEARVLPVGGARDIAAALRIASAVRAQRPAILHLHAGGRARLWPLRAARGAKVVAHLHAVRGEDGVPLQLDALLRRADAVIATSAAIAAEAWVAATVVHPGVSIPAQAATRPDGPPAIGTVGRLEPVKGLETLLEAFSALAPAHPDLRLEIAGRGSCEPELRASAARMGLADRVDFLGWREDVAALHARWRMFAQPSRHEGFGLAALEAMASGLPVVASATGGLPELVEDGRTGLLAPAGDATALARQLDRLLTDDRLRERLGAAGRQRAAERFGVAAMVAGIEAVYARLLAG